MFKVVVATALAFVLVCLASCSGGGGGSSSSSSGGTSNGGSSGGGDKATVELTGTTAPKIGQYGLDKYGQQDVTKIVDTFTTCYIDPEIEVCIVGSETTESFIKLSVSGNVLTAEIIKPTTYTKSNLLFGEGFPIVEESDPSKQVGFVYIWTGKETFEESEHHITSLKWVFGETHGYYAVTN